MTTDTVGNITVRPSRVLLMHRPGHGVRAVGFAGLVDGKSLVACSTHIACTACKACRAGLSAHCEQQLLLDGSDPAASCLQEQVSVPAHAAVEVPADGAIDASAAAFAPLIGEALHAARTASPASNDFVSVLGTGPLATIIAHLLASRGTGVRMLTDDTAQLELCAKLGLRHRAQREAGLRRDQNVVIDAEGSTESLSLAAQLLTPRGTLVLLASQASADLAEFIHREARIVGVRGCDTRAGMAELTAGAIDISAMDVHR